jgi:hypothetical protein
MGQPGMLGVFALKHAAKEHSKLAAMAQCSLLVHSMCAGQLLVLCWFQRAEHPAAERGSLTERSS